MDKREQIARAIEEADSRLAYSIGLTRLIDGEATYLLKLDGREPAEFPSHAAAFEAVEQARNEMRADAIMALEDHAPKGWRPAHDGLDWVVDEAAIERTVEHVGLNKGTIRSAIRDYFDEVFPTPPVKGEG